MILDKIDQLTPDELAAGVYQILYSGTADRATYEKLRDRRLMPILNTIIQTNGRPPFAPREDLPKDLTDQVMISAAYLLGDIARPEDHETVQALINMMDNENDRIKLVTATALGQIGVTAAVEKVLAFTERMMSQGEIGAVSKLARALAKIGNEEAKDSFERFIDQNRNAADKQVQHALSEMHAAIQSINDRIA